jgi:hypothetical protein
VATYLRVRWIHDFEAEPVLIATELDDERYERRKVEIYRDGRHDFADGERETGTTFLGEGATPPVDEVNSQSEFIAETIDRNEFERLWRSALAYQGDENPGGSAPG